MTTPTERQQYRTLVAEVAAKAKATLPASVNGRLEGAVALVLQEAVWPQEDGSIKVGSCTDPLKVYHLVGTTCECKDFTDGKAPEGWCRHRIAAGISKRVQELMPVQSDHDQTETPPLPEAPVSITLKATLHGHEVLVTLRRVDFASVKAQVEQASQWLRSQAPAQLPTTRPEGWCATHQVQMTWNDGKEGRTGWFSHKTDQGWCKGKGR